MSEKRVRERERERAVYNHFASSRPYYFDRHSNIFATTPAGRRLLRCHQLITVRIKEFADVADERARACVEERKKKEKRGAGGRRWEKRKKARSGAENVEGRRVKKEWKVGVGCKGWVRGSRTLRRLLPCMSRVFRVHRPRCMHTMHQHQPPPQPPQPPQLPILRHIVFMAKEYRGALRVQVWLGLKSPLFRAQRHAHPLPRYLSQYGPSTRPDSTHRLRVVGLYVE